MVEVQSRAVDPSISSREPSSAGHRLEVARTPSIDFYRQLVEGMTCGVLTIDATGLITTINDHARTILGLDKAALGSSCDAALAHCPRLAQLLRDSFTMSSPPSRAEMDIPVRGGRRRRTIGFTISMIAAPSSNRIEGAAVFFKDLTRVEELAERERLRDRLAALGSMAAQMAHEIRNPLTSIQLSAALMQRRIAARGEPTDLLQKIGAEVDRIEASIANCLEYAKPLMPDMTPTDPAALLDDAVALARVRAGSEQVEVTRAYEPGRMEILCDRTLIKESLVNLLVNAYEALEGRGAITVSAEPVPPRPSSLQDEEPLTGERHALLRISDTGPGIPAHLIDRIFFPFFTTKTTGSGIGLAMVRKVVESHGGWLDVESEPGKGTTFTLKLPLLEDVAGGAR